MSRPKPCVVCLERPRDHEATSAYPFCSACRKAWLSRSLSEWDDDLSWAANRARFFERKRAKAVWRLPQLCRAPCGTCERCKRERAADARAIERRKAKGTKCKPTKGAPQ